MNYDEFIGTVQQEAEYGTRGEAARASRAVLTTLGERLQATEAGDLAGPLPMEVDRHVLRGRSGQQFDYDEFVRRVAERSGHADREEAEREVEAVFGVVREAVPEGEFEDVLANLPGEFHSRLA